MYKEELLYFEISEGQSQKVVAGESFASSQYTAHYCQNIGDEKWSFFSASEGSKCKETTVPNE
tara:strand:- start:150 stop:338 length:189 start_codon:yes stop_codon:yes gene_type:complete